MSLWFLVKDEWEGRIGMVTACQDHLQDFISLNGGMHAIREISEEETSIFLVMCR